MTSVAVSEGVPGHLCARGPGDALMEIEEEAGDVINASGNPVLSGPG